jgi:hypothetical protein
MKRSRSQRERDGEGDGEGEGVGAGSIVDTVLESAPFALNELLDRPDGSGYKEIFNCLLANTAEQFFANNFEKRPCHIVRRSCPRQDSSPDLFSGDELLSVLSERTIAHSSNMTVCRYEKKDKRVTREFSGPYVSAHDIAESFSLGWTVQFYQPQRFSETLHRINAGFEHTFGTLAGASAYLTPPASQGLAPHYDDVEVFVLQTQGTKLWRVWAESADFLRLPESCSFDINRGNLPKNYVEILLKQGDVLYLPRGTIHEAEATEHFSTHVTISVYQQHTYKTLLKQVLPRLIDEAFLKEVDMRTGLPLRLGEIFGSFTSAALDSNKELQCLLPKRKKGHKDKDDSPNPDTSIRLSRRQVCDKLCDVIKSLSGYLSEDMVDEAADKMQSNTTQHRLPPPDLLCEGGEEPVALTEATPVTLIDPRSFFYYISTSEEVDACGRVIKVISLSHSKYNDRERHMDHPRPADIKPTPGSGAGGGAAGEGLEGEAAQGGDSDDGGNASASEDDDVDDDVDDDDEDADEEMYMMPAGLDRDELEEGSASADAAEDSSDASGDEGRGALSIDLELPMAALPVLAALIADYRARGGGGAGGRGGAGGLSARNICSHFLRKRSVMTTTEVKCLLFSRCIL